MSNATGDDRVNNQVIQREKDRPPHAWITEQHETLALSEKDRRMFFDVLMAPPRANERLERAFEAARRRVRT